MAGISKTTIGTSETSNRARFIFSTFIYSIGLPKGLDVSSIKINGKTYGNREGANMNLLMLNKEEYISQIEYLSHPERFLSYLKFTTNLGRSIESGVASCEFSNKLKNIRLLEIGGKCVLGALQTLTFTFIKNYLPSTCLATNQNFILEVTESCGEYPSRYGKMVDTFEIITAQMMNRSHGTSVESEFVLKAAGTLDIDLRGKRQFELPYLLVNFQKKLEKILQKQGPQSKKIIPEGYIGIKVVNGDFMKGGDGIFWMFPKSAVGYYVVKLSDANKLHGFYDLTGQLFMVMPALRSCAKFANGYIYYGHDSPSSF